MWFFKNILLQLCVLKLLDNSDKSNWNLCSFSEHAELYRFWNTFFNNYTTLFVTANLNVLFIMLDNLIETTYSEEWDVFGHTMMMESICFDLNEEENFNEVYYT
jgi:hypothetical protein